MNVGAHERRHGDYKCTDLPSNRVEEFHWRKWEVGRSECGVGWLLWTGGNGPGGPFLPGFRLGADGVELAGTVAERSDACTRNVEHGEVEVGKWRFFWESEVLARL